MCGIFDCPICRNDKNKEKSQWKIENTKLFKTSKILFQLERI